MKHLFHLAFLLALMVAGASCSDGDDPVAPPTPPTPPAPPEEPTEEVVEFGLNTLIQTQYEHSAELDSYLIAVASDAVVFDEEQYLYHTGGDGYVLYLNLLAASSADPGHPALPDGTYTAGMDYRAGVWNLDGGLGILIRHTTAEGMQVEAVAEGELRSKYNGTAYTMELNFKTDAGNAYRAKYNGTLEFQGIAPESDNKLTDPVDTEFIGGQACYMGADPDFGDVGIVRLELYDAAPDPQLGTIYGNIVKAQLGIPLPEGAFDCLPAGTYEVGFGAGAFTAAPGYDDGVNIPTGTYIAQTLSPDEPMKLAMIDGGTITVTEEGFVTINLSTTDWVSIHGVLNRPVETLDMSGQGGGDEPSKPEGPFSTITADKVIALDDVAVGYLYDYGDQYGNSTRNVVLQVLSPATMTGFLLDLALPAAEAGAPLAEGTYTLDDGTHTAFSFAPGRIFGPNAVGSWAFVSLYRDGEYTLVDFTNAANATGGTLDILRTGVGYTLTFNLLDDAPAPHSITGSWTGTFEDMSYTAL